METSRRHNSQCFVSQSHRDPRTAVSKISINYFMTFLTYLTSRATYTWYLPFVSLVKSILANCHSVRFPISLTSRNALVRWDTWLSIIGCIPLLFYDTPSHAKLIQWFSSQARPFPISHSPFLIKASFLIPHFPLQQLVTYILSNVKIGII